VINSFILVFFGGAMGAMLREFIMLMVPSLSNHFPLDILVANLVAAVVLGLVTALHSRRVLSDGVSMMVGTGMMGGLSTFSSFAYGAVVLMSVSTESAVVALAYVVSSLVLGYIAVVIGLKLGGHSKAVTNAG
jgi:fluoride exporter